MNGGSRRSAPHRRGFSPAQDPIRILVAVPDELDRSGLVALLATQPEFRVVGEDETALGAACRCLQQDHDVLLVDLALSRTAHDSAVTLILEHSPETPIVVLALHNEENCWLLDGRPAQEVRDAHLRESAYPPCLKVALAQGAMGAVLRTAPAEELFAALRCVATGRPWVESSLLRRGAVAEPVDEVALPLSPREREIAVLVSDGQSNKEIADVLGICEATVKKHIGHIFTKIAVQDRLQLGLYVVRQAHMFRET
jgi:DNA-binding NarL/FixJ family response regulator